MADWKKVIVSGSAAELKTLSLTGLTAAPSETTVLTLTQNVKGVAGNTAIGGTIFTGDEYYANQTTKNGAAGPLAFSGGVTASSAVPILRGVLLAPSGVILHLSGNSAANGSDAPAKNTQAATANGVIVGREGSLTGSLNLASQEFVMLMNGYNNTDVSKKTHITASFDMTSPNYFANVFNTNPFKIEEEGHLLYSHYDVYPDLAAVTGSGIVTAGVYSKGSAASSMEDIALLLTSSVGRGLAVTDKPVYEDFEDRYTHGKTPFIISQNFGSSPKNLFRIHFLSDGKGMSNKFKF